MAQGHYYDSYQDDFKSHSDFDINAPWSYPQGGYAMESNNSQESCDSCFTGYTGSTSPLPSPRAEEIAMSSNGSPPLPSRSDIYYPISVYSDNNMGNQSGNRQTLALDQDLYHGQRPRCTVSTLGWAGTELISALLKIYTFIPKKGPDTHFELLPEYSETSSTPRRVYLDSPSDLPTYIKGNFPCQYPKFCQSVFKRPADLDRHYEHVHASREQRKKFECDYLKCDRKEENAFGRKDHYRDHLKEYHKEDLGCAKKSRQDPSPQKTQETWKKERKIDRHWWRCAKCLIRVYIKEFGWGCSICKQPCEPDRRKAREFLRMDLVQPEVYSSESYSACPDCKWSENSQWVPCSSCGLLEESSYYYDSSNGTSAYSIT